MLFLCTVDGGDFEGELQEDFPGDLQLRESAGQTRMRWIRICLTTNLEHPSPQSALQFFVLLGCPTKECAHRSRKISLFAIALAFAQPGSIDIACMCFDDQQA